MGAIRAIYKNKCKVYPDRFELPNRAKYINGTYFVHISKLKTMMIDGVSYYYGNVNGFIHFYPKGNRCFNADKVMEFVNSLELPIIQEGEECVGDFGIKYKGYCMNYDTFIHILPQYVYFVEQIKPYRENNYMDSETFKQYMCWENCIC